MVSHKKNPSPNRPSAKQAPKQAPKRATKRAQSPAQAPKPVFSGRKLKPKRVKPSKISNVKFSDSRKLHDSHKGSIDQMEVNPRSSEGNSAYVRRKGHKTFAEEKQRKSHKKHILIALFILALAVAAAVAVGAYAYFTKTDAKLDLAPSNAPEALVAAKEGEPYYILCTAEIGKWKSAPASYSNPQLERGYMLVRLDPNNRKISFVTIPIDLEVRYSDGEYRPLSQATSMGGDAELVRRVAAFFGIDINHFAATTANGISNMVDALGGIELFLESEIDDPYAGIYVLSAGSQMLNVKQAATFLRAGNLLSGIEDISKNRVKFTMALATKALSAEGLDYAALVNEASNYMNTSLTAADLLSLADAMRPLESAAVYECLIPGYQTQDTSTGEDIYECYTDEWTPMLERFIAGEDPMGVDSSAENVVPGEITVEVRNGTQMNGAGAKMAEILESAGYNVIQVGNAGGGITYPETLVVYTDEAYEGAARAIVRDMANGRTVNGGDFYSSEANIISIVGADWTPLS